MIGITTRNYRGFAILIQCNGKASPPCRATIRRQFQEAHPRPGGFNGASEEDVVSQAKALIDRIWGGESP
jgi:hypothetical protein